MKPICWILSLCIIPLMLHAESSLNANASSAEPSNNIPWGLRAKISYEALSPQVQKQFDATREKALKNLKVQELRLKANRVGGEAYESKCQAIIQADPSVAKFIKNRCPAKMATLSEENRLQCVAAQQKAMQDPNVQTLHKQSDIAEKEYFHALSQTMAKINPHLTQILKEDPYIVSYYGKRKQ